MPAYYNENDPAAAAQLRELIARGHIAPGDVDERSIRDIESKDLAPYTQCHFFAGIGIWPAALRFAGWPDSRPVWTGSCPCQGYSNAGKGEGTNDDRDLWPPFAALIRERRPNVVLGEQVQAAIRYGWLDRLRTDLEAEDYAVGSIVLGAHSAGADHRRQRLWWMAHSQRPRLERHTRHEDNGHEPGRNNAVPAGSIAESCHFNLWTDTAWHYCRDGKRRRIPADTAPQSGFCALVDAGTDARPAMDGRRDCGPAEAEEVTPGWDGSLFPLAPKMANRPALLKGAGNAICLGTAALFITAAMDALNQEPRQ